MEFSTAAKIVSRRDAARWIQEQQARGKKIVFTNGCFDLLHVGHVVYLEQARSLGDALIVAVNTDASVRRLSKGSGRPFNSESDRVRVLAALASVDRVVLFPEETPQEIVTELQPDVLVKGGDYTLDGIVGREVVLAKAGRVEVIPFVPGYSTTDLVARIRRRGSP
jgi:D-beta-D-heptose 7-phosphate kinase/D-beta-D-heptose 1-phosphate adenosyltransferase